jgi:Rap1a immunity proteins
MITNRLWAAGRFVLLAALLCGSARAAVTADNFLLRNTGDLIAVCSAGANDPLMTAAANFCQGFMLGVYRTLQDEQAAMPSKLFCVNPPLPTRSQAISRFVSWAQSRSDILSQRPEDAIVAYLQQRFPCAPGR